MSAHPGVTVRVPASTSNCGAGFDTLGLALALYNRVKVWPAAGDRPVAALPADQRGLEMAGETAAAFAAFTRKAAGGFTFHVEGDVPVARGLGSSVTLIAGILAGLDALHGTGLSRAQLVGIASDLEGHPDNASAGILGGFCVARSDPKNGDFVDAQRFTVPPEIAFVVVSPPLELMTKVSRGVLPVQLPYFDAVKSVNSAAFLVAAIVANDWPRLRHAAGDFLHEPYRLPRIPGASAAIQAGLAAGAWTGWLSGSGSSVLCVSERAAAPAVCAAMEAAFAKVGPPAAARILAADNQGLVVEA
jgi:homoserine kinase